MGQVLLSSYTYKGKASKTGEKRKSELESRGRIRFFTIWGDKASNFVPKYEILTLYCAKQSSNMQNPHFHPVYKTYGQI